MACDLQAKLHHGMWSSQVIWKSWPLTVFMSEKIIGMIFLVPIIYKCNMELLRDLFVHLEILVFWIFKDYWTRVWLQERSAIYFMIYIYAHREETENHVYWATRCNHISCYCVCSLTGPRKYWFHTRDQPHSSLC